MLVRLTWYQYFNVCRYDQIHKILTAEHKELPVVHNLAVLKLVARTGNFIPTPSANQIVFNAQNSLNIFCIRVYKTLSKAVHRDLILKGQEEARLIGIPRWKPMVFNHSDIVLKKQRSFFFSNANSTWRNNRGNFPELPSTLAVFETDVLRKAEAISKSLNGSKWQNLSVPERSAIRELRSSPEIRVGNADKGMGPAIVSESIHVQQLISTLRDNNGTYREIYNASMIDVLKQTDSDFKILTASFKNIKGFKPLFKTLSNWHRDCLNEPKLCPIRLLYKVHKPGRETRPIIDNTNYYTGQDSNFLHCLLAPVVFRNAHVLKDSLTLIRKLDEVRIPAGHNFRFATFDVTALYPSIDLERGLKSLRWFLNTFCNDFHDEVKKLVLSLSRFVLTHCYISCPEVSANPFLQLVGTAMGTSFAVVYANIHLICIETEIIYSFNVCFRFYFRFIDDGITLWHGSDEDFQVFSQAFNSIDPTIRFIWSNLSKLAIFLDLSIEISTGLIHYEVYSKPGNAYAYLPLGSYHVRSSFSAWIKAELIRALTHSSDIHRWGKRCQLFFEKLRQRGYNTTFLLIEFAKVSWRDRFEALSPKSRMIAPFDLRCVWSCANSPGLRALFKSSKLDLSEIDARIFLTHLSTVTKGAKRLSTYLKK